MEISVKLEHDSTAKGVVRFRTTRWTVVMISAQSQAREGRAAFAELYQLYRYPLYAFARRGGHSPEDAQDLTQGFFLHLLEHGALTHVDRLKGKFRSFLLVSNCISQRKNASFLAGGLPFWSTRKGLRSGSSSR
jgi:hypothetical protein